MAKPAILKDPEYGLYQGTHDSYKDAEVATAALRKTRRGRQFIVQPFGVDKGTIGLGGLYNLADPTRWVEIPGKFSVWDVTDVDPHTLIQPRK